MDPDNLRAVPLFASMPEPDLKRIATFAAEDSVPAGTTLMREGDYSNEMVAIESGTAEVIQGGSTVASLGPGDVFGETGVLGRELRNATVVASSPMRLIRLSTWEVKRLPAETRDRLAELAGSRKPEAAGVSQGSSTTLPTVARVSSALCAAAASASRKRVSSGTRRPSAAAARARSSSSRIDPGRTSAELTVRPRETMSPLVIAVIRTARPPVEDVAPAAGQQLERGAAGIAADAVERDRHLAAVERLAHRLRPARARVVDGDRGADAVELLR